MRIGGLASGMDIDSIVNNLMKAERIPLTQIQQKKQILEWQRDDYRSMNTLLLNFRNNDLSSMRYTAAYRARLVSSSDESKVSATVSSSANQAAYNISKVEQLARAEVKINAGRIGDIDTNKSIYSQSSSFANGNFKWNEGAVLSETIKVDAASNNFTLNDSSNIKKEDIGSWSVKVDGKSYKVITSGEPKDDQVLVNDQGELKFKNEIKAGSEIKVDYIGNSKTDKVAVAPNGSVQLSQVGLTIPDNTVFTLTTTVKGEETPTTTNYKSQNDANGTHISIVDDKGIKIGSIEKETGILTFTEDAPKVDENTSHTLDVTYAHKYSTFSMSTETSKGAQYENFIITGKDSVKNVMDKVNGSKVGVSMFYDSATGRMTLTRSETGKFAASGDDIKFEGSIMNDLLGFAGAETTAGQNAKFTINGLNTERNSNTFTIDGVTFTIKQTFDSTDAPVTVGVTSDSTKVYDNIKGFIDSYNELIGKIQGEVDEKRYKDYLPLSDEDREGLSDKQQEKWEELAKSGMLRRDPILSSVLSEMRSDFYGTVNNSEISSAYNQLAKIGITTSKNYLEGGKLEINESQLKKAIEEDPASVEQLFRGEGGIIQRLTETVTQSMDKIKSKAGSSSSVNNQFSIGRELDRMEDRENRFEDRLQMVEARYWRQFTAMEQAINRSNSQSAYLMQQFGG